MTNECISKRSSQWIQFNEIIHRRSNCWIITWHRHPVAVAARLAYQTTPLPANALPLLTNGVRETASLFYTAVFVISLIIVILCKRLLALTQSHYHISRFSRHCYKCYHVRPDAALFLGSLFKAVSRAVMTFYKAMFTTPRPNLWCYSSLVKFYIF